jgi:hypothetical protein
MLNLGEAMFSLLIVDIPNEDDDFYTAFYCSVLSVIFLNVLHFKSQPLHEDHHALRRNKNAGYVYFTLTHIYTISLVTLGAAYTFILLDVNKGKYDSTSDNSASNSNSSHRWLHDSTSSITNRNNNILDFHPHRWLADDSTAENDCGLLQLTDDIYRRNVALTFCLSLAMIFACLDLMTLCHLGIKTSQERCFCSQKKQYNIRGLIVVLCRVGLVIFTATMAIWEENVKNLTIIGLCLTILQIAVRKLGAFFYNLRQKERN